MSNKHIESLNICFNFTGTYKSFVLNPGIYHIKIAGSKGAPDTTYNLNYGGNGAFIDARIKIENATLFYAYVGGTTSFNGGGNGQSPSGAASDIRLVPGLWNDFESLKSRIIVAGGGGGTDSRDRGGSGGLNGHQSDLKHGTGGNQTSGGEGLIPGRFGAGGHYSKGTGGGGGGYYGGGSSDNPSDYGGGGGSSFISGYKGCDAINESSLIFNITHTGSPLHYSGLKFTNVIVRDGANTGKGYIKIEMLPALNVLSCRCRNNRFGINSYFILLIMKSN